MKGFLLGLIVAGLAFGGYTFWKQRGGFGPHAPAAAHVDAGAPPKEAKGGKKRKRPRGATRVAELDGATPGGKPAQPPPPPEHGFDDIEPEPIKLSAADLKIVGQGDDLSKPDVVRLDMADDNGSRELTQDEIDARFRAKEDAILGCIQHARPDEETWVPGRVTVRFRIQRTGNVRGVRVEAPAILQKGGIYGCIKGIVGGLRFPPSGGSQVITYPFSLT
jgi:hypothetical protein